MFRALFLQIVFLSLLFSSHPAQSAALDPADDAALVALYNATNGASWSNNTGWSGTTGIMDTVTNPPYGVTFDGTGRVTAVILNSNSLVGDISALDFSGMTSMTDLQLHINSLSGGLPNVANLPTGLQLLILDSNPLGGSIPDYSALTSLTELRVKDCQLTGGLPTAAQLPPNVQSLSLSDNQFTGSFPDYSVRMALSNIWATNIQISGSLPLAVQLPPSIGQLRISSNYLTGTIPDYSSLSSLYYLVLMGSGLTGGLPTAAQLPSNIGILSIGSTSITGTFPDYSSLSSLGTLGITGNTMLEGDLPTVAELPTSITYFYLVGSSLTGPIPDYSTIPSLSQAYLYDMNIQGPTPSGLLAWGGLAVFTTTPAIDPALDGSDHLAEIITVTGTGGEIGGTVDLLLDGVSIETGITVGGAGEWSTTLDLTGKADGVYTLTASSTFDNWPGQPSGQQTSAVSSTPVTINVVTPSSGGGGGGGAPGLPLLAVFVALLPWRKLRRAVLNTEN